MFQTGNAAQLPKHQRLHRTRPAVTLRCLLVVAEMSRNTPGIIGTHILHSPANTQRLLSPGETGSLAEFYEETKEPQHPEAANSYK